MLRNPIYSTRRLGRHLVAALLLAGFASGCAPRAAPEQLLPVANPPAGLQEIRLFAVTNRTADGTGLAYGGGRGVTSYEELTIGIRTADAEGPEHDLAEDFVTLRRQKIPEGSFGDHVADAGTGGQGSIFVFVHGYNYSYQEAVFRLAQLSADGSEDLVPILFSWPSQADVKGYVADRDSATYARDDLADLLIMLADRNPGERITLAAHSMGSWLVMETLRQLTLQGRRDVVQRLEVGLAAPDIDLDVFRTQVSTVGRLNPPLTVLVSRDDRALAVSKRLGEGQPRLGAVPVDDPGIQKLAAQAGLRIIDITSLPAGDALRHDRFVVLAQMGEKATQGDLLGHRLQNSGAFILNTTGSIVAAPFSITASILEGL